MSRTPSLQLLAAALLLSASAAPAQEYEVLNLGPHGHSHQPWSINQNGQVVGWTYELPADNDEGFVYDGEAVGKSGTVYENGEAILWRPGGGHGHINSLGTLGGSRSSGRSINDLSQVVGWSRLAGDSTSRAFLWQDDVMAALPVLGGDQADANWINNVGQIVGSSTTDTDGLQQFGVIWEDGNVTRLPPVYAGQSNIANYIHDNGDIAGSIREPEWDFSARAAIWRDGEVYLRLGTLADGTPVEPFAGSWASAINADGVAIGMSVNAESHLVPFVWRDGAMTQLDELMPDPWVAIAVGRGAINDAGQIAVSAFIPGEGTGDRYALLLAPTESAAVTNNVTPHGYILSARAREITFSIPEATSVSLRLFGASGQLVARLVDGARPAGEHVTVWDGRTFRGDRASSGVYFVKLETPAHRMTCRVVLAR
jgi:probable HAF family extracellular repeat protein